MWSLGGWCVTWLVCCGLTILTWAALGTSERWPPDAWGRFAMLALAAVVYLAGTAGRRRGDGHIDQTGVWLLAAAIVLPAILALALLCVRRRHFLAGGIGVLAVHTVVGPLPAFPLDTGRAVVTAAIAAAVYFSAETVIPAVGRVLRRRPDGAGITGWAAFRRHRRGDGTWESPAFGTAAQNLLLARGLALGLLAAGAAVPLHGIALVALVAPIVLGDTRREQRLQNEKLVSERRRIDALTDSMTGLLNKNGFGVAAGYRHDRDRAAGRPTAVAVIDVDNFKRINDTFGHPAGDDVLRALAGLLLPSTVDKSNRGKVLRADDVVGRTGGDEFTAVLPGATAAEAREVMERLRDRVAGLEVAVTRGAGGPPVTIGVTLSIGVAEIGRKHTFSDAARQADAAAYKSKAGGRNRVTVFAPDTPVFADAVRSAVLH